MNQVELKKLLCYNPNTGLFTWRVSRAQIKIGSVAGTITHKGYTQIKIKGKCYRAGRLAILYMEGEFPNGQVDHDNRIRNDDRYCNLVKCFQSYNERNQATPKNNTTSGIKGVGRNHGKWLARITVCGKFRHLGLYVNKINAVCARYAAEQCLAWGGYSPAKHYLIDKKVLST